MSKDRSISSLLASGETIRSIEFFPPRDEAAWDRFCETARELLTIEPDFVSVTYGAGGTTQDRTAQAARFLKNDLNLLVMPHLTCVGASREKIRSVVDDFYEAGFRNIMALRGDPPKGETSFVPVHEGLAYGSDLVSLLKDSYPDICIGVAGYPEKHPEAIDFETDLKNLKTKVDKGADFVTTQLFFNNDDYFAFVDRCRELEIKVPIIPGIMPVLAYNQILRFTKMCGATLPGSLLESLEKAQDDPEQIEAIGIDWAIKQIDDLLARGAPGYHLYILNRSAPALALCNGLQNRRATQSF